MPDLLTIIHVNKRRPFHAIAQPSQGASRQTISQIERGDYSPSVTLALKLARALNVTVEEIFSYEEEDEQ